MRVLIVEDDEDIASLLKRGFEMEGYDTDCVGTGEDAISRFSDGAYGTVILDVTLPRRSGLEVCKHIRETGGEATVIMLSAHDAVADRIEGLSAGADDYVVKPFDFAELLARVRAGERRALNVPGILEGQPEIAAGVSFDPSIRKLSSQERSVLLTAREAGLLMLFMTSPGQPLTRDEIFEALWARDGGNAINVVDVYIGYLRRKLDAVAANGKAVIKTVRGKGFLFDPS